MNGFKGLHRMTRLSFILVPLLLLLATTAVTAASVSLRWDPNDPAPEGYRVFARKSGQAYNFSQPDWEGAATTCTIGVLDGGTDCYFVVRAFDGDLESADSEEVKIRRR
jgi:chitinase